MLRVPALNPCMQDADAVWSADALRGEVRFHQPTDTGKGSASRLINVSQEAKRTGAYWSHRVLNVQREIPPLGRDHAPHRPKADEIAIW